MKNDDSIFAVKLYEMEEQYGKLQCRIRICEQGGSDKIHSELEKAEEEYKENTMLLEEKARSSRSLAVQRLIRAQLDYRQKTADLMKDDIIKDMHSEDNSLEEKNAFLNGLSVKEIIEFAENVPLEQVDFMKQAEALNDALSKEGLTGKYGLAIGCALQRKQEKGLVGKDLMNEVVIRTVAASDARMGGAPLPAMTNSGSGNQGISATEPVVVVADYVKANDEDRLRAMVLSHMMAIYTHSFLPKLSALCATLTASMGSASGMAWLLDREHAEQTISNAICSMTGDAIGMVCDGAANSCSMKVVTAVSSAYRSVMLALDNIRVGGDDGLVAHDVDECVRNVGCLACQGMKVTDDEILNIMLHKNKGC